MISVAALCQECGIHLLASISISCEFLCIPAPSENLPKLSSFQRDLLPLGKGHGIKISPLRFLRITNLRYFAQPESKFYESMFLFFPSHNQIVTKLDPFIY